MPISSSKSLRGMAVEMPKPPDTMRLSIGPKSKLMPENCKLGDKVTVMVMGQVTSLREDEYGKSFEMEVTGVKKSYAKEKAEEKE